MTPLDYILDGLEAALALERDLGTRSVEFDRTLLEQAVPQREKAAPLPSVVPQRTEPPPSLPPTSPVVVAPRATPAQTSMSATPPVQNPASVPPAPTSADAVFDFVFLHDRPLTGAGAEMISKIAAAMRHTSATAPVVVEPPRPKALVYVVLGDRALKKWFPGLRAGPGMWIATGEGDEALVTYSPNYILRFGEVTPAVRKIKSDMWTSLKGVLQRIALKRK